MAQKTKNVILGLIPFIAVGILWFLGSRFSIFPDWMIPSPAKTARTFYELITNGTLLGLAWLSLKNALIGFTLAMIFALALGIPVGIYPTARKIFFPFFSAIYIIPSLAWLPLLILALGFTKTTVIFLIFFSSFKKIFYSIVSGVRGVHSSWILAGKNIGLGEFEVIYKIIIPAALPQIITGARLGFVSSWRTLIGAEMLIAGTAGLGRFIWTAQWFFDFDKVFSGILLIAIIGITTEQFIFRNLEEKTLAKWGLSEE